MNQDEIKLVVEEVLKTIGSVNAAPSCSPAGANKVTKDQYPLGEKMPDKVFSASGKRLSDMKIEQIYDGTLTAEDMRISAETLEMQAQISESANNAAFATNLRRAAELIPVPDARLLEIYNALRPYRSTKQQLLDIANELDSQYGAKNSAALVREAAEVYEKRDRLKKD